MPELVKTPAEALARYQDFLDHDQLVQAAWHKEVDGRQLACGLGVLGDTVRNPSDCPANIMPRWLAQMVPWLFDGQTFADAKVWGVAFYGELARLNGAVPFSVVHDWRANFVMPLRIAVAELKKRDPAPHAAVQALHLRALAGEKVSRQEWFEALRKSYVDADAYAYAYADADAYAYAYADAYAYANAYAYADAYAFKKKKTETIKALADGLVVCMARAKPDETEK